ncbi:hypothetical protein ENKNEFLB_02629 [Nocardioides aquaticus]|uniref:Uncharacterized protein n=1 Tax=Nocardioides aquaticus TaxID=160826 RepID=A0ABX8ENN3_9ACTN|nr:hypothetical protein ENKNEFLB_02629 [Nocardioides aquaticus]
MTGGVGQDAAHIGIFRAVEQDRRTKSEGSILLTLKFVVGAD